MIKNYTSQQPASRSINYIEQCLAKHGADRIMKEYKDERVTAVTFQININGSPTLFKLPAEVDACEKVLMQETTSRTRPETIKKIPHQAERTAWKICLDWVEAQMAMIQLAQVDFLQVFLPYAYDPATDRTLYDRIKDDGIAGYLK